MIKIQIREMDQKTRIPGTMQATKQDESTKTHRHVITRVSLCAISASPEEARGNKTVVIHVLVLNNPNTPRTANT